MVQKYKNTGCAAVTAVALALVSATIPAAAHGSEQQRSNVQNEADERTIEWVSEWDKNKATQPSKISDNSTYRETQDEKNTNPVVRYKTDEKGIVTDRIFSSASPRTIDGDTGRTSLQWEGTNDVTKLSWWTPDPSVEWIVERDGKQLEKTRDSSYIDKSVDRDKNHEYTVRATVKDKSILEDSEASEYFYSVNIPPTESESIGKSINDASLLTRDSNRDLAGLSNSSGTSPQVLRESFVAYGSFIPEARIKKPTPCGPASYDQYGGDNRTFAHSKNPDWEKLRYRGLNIAYITWDGLKPKLDEAYRKVGTTHAYENGKQVASKTASNSGLTTKLETGNAGTANIHFKQAIANPLCSLPGGAEAPDINADVNVKLNKSTGASVVTGKHDGAPNHEILMHNTASDKLQRGCLYRFEHGSFNSLLPPMDVDIDINRNPGGNWTQSCPINSK